MNPGNACKRGKHIPGRHSALYDKCAWCGVLLPLRDAASAETPPSIAPTETLSSEGIAPSHTACATESAGRNGNPTSDDERFRTLARDYAAHSPFLTHWVQSGNKLPTCYL